MSQVRGVLIGVAGTIAILAAIGAGFGVGRWSAPKPQISESEVRRTGLFGKETSQILSATVNSLKAENKLIVYQYSGETRVSIKRTELGGMLTGTQELIVPATVEYVLELGDLGPQNLRFDRASNTVHVKLPPLMIGKVAFRPERARHLNGGLLTLSPQVTEELSKANYALARKAFIQQARGSSIVDVAKLQARQNVAAYFTIPLRAVGETDIKVNTYFPTR